MWYVIIVSGVIVTYENLFGSIWLLRELQTWWHFQYTQITSRPLTDRLINRAMTPANKMLSKQVGTSYTPVFDLVWESLGGFPAKGLLTNQKIEHDWRTSLRQTTRVFVWPWPWPSDPDTWPWRRYSYDVNVCQKWSFLRLWFRRDYLNPLKCSDVR